MKKFQEILTSTWEPDDISQGAKCILLCVLCTLYSALIYTIVKTCIMWNYSQCPLVNCAESRKPCVRNHINSSTIIQPVIAKFFAPVLTSDLMLIEYQENFFIIANLSLCVSSYKWYLNKGRVALPFGTKSDEFSEKFQRRGGGGSFSIQKFILQILNLYKGPFSDGIFQTFIRFGSATLP